MMFLTHELCKLLRVLNVDNLLTNLSHEITLTGCVADGTLVRRTWLGSSQARYFNRLEGINF